MSKIYLDKAGYENYLKSLEDIRQGIRLLNVKENLEYKFHNFLASSSSTATSSSSIVRNCCSPIFLMDTSDAIIELGSTSGKIVNLLSIKF